ncbi:MAG: hypothetical protein ONB05_07445 [candidate division KSB1 bacterium]|nr:hypothetical protein [candidate division KSB1 bacterium]
MRIKSTSSHIVILVMALIVVIGLMIYLKQGDKVSQETLPDEKFVVRDKTYFNNLYGFAISVPSTDWEIVYSEGIDTLKPENPELGVLENLNLIVNLQRKDKGQVIALVEIGIIALVQPRTSRQLVVQCLDELLNACQEKANQVNLMKEVTTTPNGSLQAAYFVIALPIAPEYPFPVRVITIVVRKQLAYCMVCQVSRENYDYFREDFEQIIQSFRFI